MAQVLADQKFCVWHSLRGLKLFFFNCNLYFIFEMGKLYLMDAVLERYLTSKTNIKQASVDSTITGSVNFIFEFSKLLIRKLRKFFRSEGNILKKV